MSTEEPQKPEEQAGDAVDSDSYQRYERPQEPRYDHTRYRGVLGTRYRTRRYGIVRRGQ